jgi:hypothetical protein
MRSTILVGFALLTFGCGDDSGGGGGAGGDGAVSTAASSGEGGGPTTTGAGGILDDGTEATIEACNAFQAAEETASTELGCAGDEYAPCTESAPSWVPCVEEWKAFYECAAPATTAARCDCDDLEDGTDLTCSYEEDCPDELEALAACDV